MGNFFEISFWKNLVAKRESSCSGKGTCEWSISCPKPYTDKWKISPTFRVSGVSHYSFNILAQIKSDKLNILVRKNELKLKEPLRASVARVRVDIPDYFCQFVDVNKWTDSCILFEDVLCLSTAPFCTSCPGARFVPIRCEIIWLGFIIDEQPSALAIRKMSDYFMKLDFSDVTLAINDEEIPAHKLVLASQSRVFSEILRSAQTTTRIELNDIDPHVMKIVLKYLYFGRTSILGNVNILQKVFRIAKNYEIEKLLNLCEFHLKKSISVDNVVQILYLSKDLSVWSLYNFALGFVADNEMKIVHRSDFKELCYKYPDITVSIIGMQPKTN